jgi:hypothetical protein
MNFMHPYSEPEFHLIIIIDTQKAINYLETVKSAVFDDAASVAYVLSELAALHLQEDNLDAASDCLDLAKNSIENVAGLDHLIHANQYKSFALFYKARNNCSLAPFFLIVML